MASINLVYTQLSAQQALLQAQANQSAFVTPPQRSLSTHTTQQINAWNLHPEKGPVPNIRKPSAHDTRDTYGETESNYVQNPQRRPIESRLGARNMNTEWDDEEDDPTYKGESTVFSILHPEHESYKQAKRAGYNPKAEHDYTLSYRPDDMAENSKFIKEIATTAIDKTKLPHNVGKYNGLTDPDDHLQVFNGAGATGGWNLPTWCHIFAQTFVGAARIWFDSLPAGRIKSWIDFREKFLAHFSQQRRHTRDPADCLNIWRKDHESVEDFITRYNKECPEIGDVGEKMMRAHFMRAVKCDDLIKRVKGRDGGPKDWETFIEAAKTIAQTDKQLTGDDHRQRGYNHNDRHNKKGRSQPWKASNHRERSPAREDARHTINQIAHRKEVKRKNREKQWTPLTKTSSEVLATENHQFKPPLQMRNKRGQDPNLFCEFHKDTGHLTDDCFSLKQEIERALRDGKLTPLVKGGKRNYRQIQRREEGPDNKKLRKLETHMVQGGPRKPRKNYNKRTQDDSWRERQVVFPIVRGGPRERRPIVISGVIGHYQTDYIFIYPGSTADIIYEQCFNQFDQEDKARLEPVDYPLTGFCN
ncbi:uncharacterized protein LOC110943325 [Helianthus annuus]|uniref:uncharacterized protein LOC110943325 n=1 Tax=Helianthus annuus TaxID=4232 RepID=UPI000B8FEA49|nr:uncharacterized protein LOC110943325 [Helianthus annuus]